VGWEERDDEERRTDVCGEPAELEETFEGVRRAWLGWYMVAEGGRAGTGGMRVEARLVEATRWREGGEGGLGAVLGRLAGGGW